MQYDGKFFPYKFTRLQFPIKIAYSLTIDRAQGQSASKYGILLPKNVWTHDQIYFSQSRCGNPNNIYVWLEQERFEYLNLPEGKKVISWSCYKVCLRLAGEGPLCMHT